MALQTGPLLMLRDSAALFDVDSQRCSTKRLVKWFIHRLTLSRALMLVMPLAWLWFGVCAALAVGISLWPPSELNVNNEGLDENKTSAIAWYRAAFQSFTSHAAGIVGFAGFNYLVVAKILMSSDPCHLFSLPNLLLYVTLALSLFAVISSCVFLLVDYMRRLAIDSARLQGVRLILQPKRLEQTGLGKTLLLLAALMLLLYVFQITKTKSEGLLRMLLSSAGGCATVSLFYINLRGLYQSPKVQFDATCHPAEQEMTLEEFLQAQQVDDPHSKWLPDWAATGVRQFAGEDLALLIAHGNRRALFPKHRFAPLLHVMFALLFIGVFPVGAHKATERLFVYPKLNDLREMTGDWVDLDSANESSESQSVGIFGMFADDGKLGQRFLLLPSSDPGTLQVTPEYRQTSSVRLCCGSTCEKKVLDHSLIRFHDKPLAFSLSNLSNASTCTLSLLGLSRGAVTNVSLSVVSKKRHHFGGCSGRICNCSEGFEGLWDFHQWNTTTLGRLNGTICRQTTFCPNGYVGTPPHQCLPAKCVGDKVNGEPGPDCKCKDGYTGQPLMDGDVQVDHNCTEADCQVPHSIGRGPSCRCNDGFKGMILWKNDVAEGYCKPAPCLVQNSIGSGPNASCEPGFRGSITWQGSKPLGHCQPAECNVENSNKLPGKACKCADGFQGVIKWHGAHPDSKHCVPAPCHVVNSTREPGVTCKCNNLHVGKISWAGSLATGACQPAKCVGDKLNGEPGPNCKCKDGYTGQPQMHGDILMDGDCSEADCQVPNSTGRGPSCRCKNGFEGVILWKNDVADGYCKPAPCRVKNSNQMPGHNCQCSSGFYGDIVWLGSEPSGHCIPLPCEGDNVNLKPGPLCACEDGFAGNIMRTMPKSPNFPKSSGIVGRPAFGKAMSTLEQVRLPPWARPYKGRRPKFSPSLSSLPAILEHDHHALVGECLPAPCNILGSNHEPGKRCKCADGYQGKITWEGAVAKGNCYPAVCLVAGSTGHGLNCSCADGYSGWISWSGSDASGPCREVPCEVPNSDFAGGPYCSCLPGMAKSSGLELRFRESAGQNLHVPQTFPTVAGSRKSWWIQQVTCVVLASSCFGMGSCATIRRSSGSLRRVRRREVCLAFF
eukprot:s1965_g9.t1